MRLVYEQPKVIPTGEIEHTEAARAIIVLGHMILVCRGSGENFTHMPGGHIDRNETPEAALLREIAEELGRPVSSYIYATETDHKFVREYDGTLEVQHSYLYKVQLLPVINENRNLSREQSITTEWYAIHELWRANLQPSFYCDLLMKLAAR